MKKLILFFLFIPLLGFAQSKFDGTWRVNYNTAQLSDKPQVYSLENGVFRCSTCTPAIEAKADGQDHTVTGQPYFDTINVKIVDDNNVQMKTSKNGKLSGNTTFSVSNNGSTLTRDGTYQPENASEPIKMKTTLERVSGTAKGTKPLTGSWREKKMEDVSQNVSRITFKTTADGLQFSMPDGESYSAKFDGKDYPYSGDPGITSVSLRRIDNNTIEETDKRDGKPIYVSRMTVSADGKTLQVVSENKLQNATSKFTATKEMMSADK